MPQKPKRQPKKKKQIRVGKVEKREITKEQFHKLVKKSAQPTKKPKSASK